MIMADQNQTGVDDRKERIMEIGLAISGTATGMAGLFLGLLEGKWAVILIIFSYTLFQSTSVAKYIKGIT